MTEPLPEIERVRDRAAVPFAAVALAPEHPAGVDVVVAGLGIDGAVAVGLARLAEDPRLTSDGSVLGTPGYLAPEVLYGEEATAASDVHSLAATLAFAAIGRPPAGTGPPMAIMDRVRRGEFDLSGVPTSVLPLIEDCLAPDPRDRPSVREILEDGERSLIFFNRTLSHAMHKRPKPGDFLVQLEHGGSIAPIDPPPELLALAPEGPPELLGDLALAYETCAREAHDKGVPLEHHAAHLIVHGLLHLAGHDHELGEAEAEAMEALEVKALALIGVADPYGPRDEA